NPMKRANLVWDEDNLRAYIRDPQATVKGNRMPYGGLPDAKDVEDIIAYLKLLKKAPVSLLPLFVPLVARGLAPRAAPLAWKLRGGAGRHHPHSLYDTPVARHPPM